MKEKYIMTTEQKARAYDEALEKAKKWYNAPNIDKIPTYGNRIIEEIFPELKESEDERIRKALIDYFDDANKSDVTPLQSYGIQTHKVIDWIEKQGELIDKEKVLIGARKDVALSIMNFLDKNTLGMFLSNIECKDLEEAVVDSDWSKVYNYMKKKLEKQGKQKPDDKCKGCNNIKGCVTCIDGSERAHIYECILNNKFYK